MPTPTTPTPRPRWSGAHPLLDQTRYVRPGSAELAALRAEVTGELRSISPDQLMVRHPRRPARAC